MPLVQFKTCERVEKEYQLILMLKEKCSKCDIFKNDTADQVYLYTVNDRHYEEPAILAFAQFNNSHAYAVCVPEDIAKDQLSIFEFFLREVKKYAEPEEKIIVFSQRDYDEIMARNTYNPIPVQLHV